MNHAIIFGCGRSGTSILGELFEYIQGYEYLFEPALERVLQFDFLGDKVLAAKVPKSPPGKCSPGLACDADALLKILPKNRTLIFIVRHPFDTICSLKPGISANWSHNPKPPFYERYMERPLVERCAHHWAYINHTGFEYLQRLGGIHAVIKYEDLVLNTAETVARLINVLNISRWDARAIDTYISRVQNDTRDSYHAKQQIVWYRPDHEKRIDRWRTQLAADEIRMARAIVEPTAIQFGYSLE